MRNLFLLCALLPPACLLSQPIQIYSEFQRIDPFGQVVTADRGEESREILSPMAARNAHTGFHVVLTPPAGEWCTLHIAQNPENAISVKLYKASFTKVGTEWVPDRLTPVALPYQGRLPDPDATVEGQSVVVLWLDLWVAADAPVRRVRLEAQYNIGNDWVIQPLELRVMAPVVADKLDAPADFVKPERRADASALARFRAFACGDKLEAAPASADDESLSFFLDRAARQDQALARASGAAGRIEIIGALLRVADVADSKALCAATVKPQSAEWCLRFRDVLLRGEE
jgi:hypothetical protein